MIFCIVNIHSFASLVTIDSNFDHFVSLPIHASSKIHMNVNNLKQRFINIYRFMNLKRFLYLLIILNPKSLKFHESKASTFAEYSTHLEEIFG